MSGPPRPRCRIHDESDCDYCRGQSKKIFGEEFHDAYFGTEEIRDTSHRPAARLLENDEGVPK